MKKMLYFGSDHGGSELKAKLMESLRPRWNFKGIEFVDIGLHTEKIDYPNVASEVCPKVLRDASMGILISSTGLGMCIAANKFNGIRAVSCHDTYSASMARAHNDANVLCLGGKVVGIELASSVSCVFLLTPFEKGRHLRRINMVRELENNVKI